jgi:hypothetical protein
MVIYDTSLQVVMVDNIKKIENCELKMKQLPGKSKIRWEVHAAEGVCGELRTLIST